MVMTIIFILLFVAIGLIWLGKREPSIYVFNMSLLLSLIVFIHHITDVIGLSL